MGTSDKTIPTDKPNFDKEKSRSKAHWLAIAGGIVIIIVGVCTALGIFSYITKTNLFFTDCGRDDESDKKKKEHSKREE